MLPATTSSHPRTTSTHSAAVPSRRRSLSRAFSKKKKTASRPPASSSVDEVKIVILGAGGVGKSSLTIQYVQRMWCEEYDPTIEDSYRKSVEHDGKTYLLDILDTAGGCEFSGMHDVWVREAHACLVVYSITDRATLSEVREKASAIHRVHDDETLPVVLVGNKVDLSDSRQVTTEEGNALAKELNFTAFVETSAKEFDSTEAAFNQLLSSVASQRAATAGRKPRRTDRSCCIM